MSLQHILYTQDITLSNGRRPIELVTLLGLDEKWLNAQSRHIIGTVVPLPWYLTGPIS
jgi:hypothetical protein